MRTVAAIALLSLLPGLALANDKITDEDRIEIVRGLMSEYATAKVLLPRSKKPLDFNSDGTFDKNEWTRIARTSPPAAQSGDEVQITKITFEPDRIVFELNHGIKSGTHWYQNIQVGMGGPMTPVPAGNAAITNGTYLQILFHKPLEAMKSADIKKMLSPILDFERRSATQLYAETLTPEIRKAIADKHVTIGMTHEQVLLAMGGQPQHKERDTEHGAELESWVFGTPPGKITFVTFSGDKVTNVKDDYAGLGTEVADPTTPR